MSIHEKLLKIQSELKAPKDQVNTFGKYKYRNLEGIEEALKPLLRERGVTLTISDEIVLVGDRVYVKSIAEITDTESKESLTNVAYAREALAKKGMDEAQVTGAASSYSRKYNLSGLFLIDDTKDADSMEPESEYITAKQMQELRNALKEAGKDEAEFLQKAGIETFAGLLASRFTGAMKNIKATKKPQDQTNEEWISEYKNEPGT